MSRERFFLDLEVGTERCLLRLAPDEAADGGYGHRLAALDLDLSQTVISLVRMLERSVRSWPNETRASADVATGVARLVRRVAPQARISVRRRVPASQVTPRWPVSANTGEPDIAACQLWPFDAELVSLELGQRRLIRRQRAIGAEADADEAWLLSRGLKVRRVAGATGADSAVLLGATEASALDEGSELEPALFSRGADWAAAAERMGQLLGYPSCCVERFARSRDRDDVTLFADLLPPNGAPASTPLNLWLNGALALISHAPCAPDCTATERLAGKILTALGRDHPGFEAIWLDHASRFHVLDVAGRSWALAVDEVAPNRYRVHDALLTTGGAPRAERRLADWRDAELFLEAHLWRRVDDPVWTAAFAQKHSG